MLPPPEALTADEAPPEPAHPEARRGGKTWRLVGDAPESDLPHKPDRSGARRGMIIVLVVGLLFWAGVAALVFILRH